MNHLVQCLTIPFPTPDDLLLLCRTWYFLSRDVQVWNEMFDRELRHWSLIVGPMIKAPQCGSDSGISMGVVTRSRPAWFNPKSLLFNDWTAALLSTIETYRSHSPSFAASSTCGDSESTCKAIEFKEERKWWIRKFFQQSRWSRSLTPSELSMESSAIFSKLRKVPMLTIPVFGPGVGAAQKVIYALVGIVMHAVSMHAGTLGIGNGIGINMDGSVYKLAAIHEPPQPFHHILKTDPNWNALFTSSSVYLYAVSNAMSIEETKKDLQSFMDLKLGEKGDAKRVPICVLSFITESTAIETAKLLGLLEWPDEQPWAIKCMGEEDKARDLIYVLKWAKSVT